MDIKPLDRTVKTLLETSFYRIPRFQRPYSGGEDNVGEFWEDAILTEDPDYFIGSFVVYRDKVDGDLRFIVDGQQRLITITILLSAIRDALAEQGESRLASAVQKLIEREDINSELRFVLESEAPYPFLQEKIQTFGENQDLKALSPEQESIAQAYEFLKKMVNNTLDAIELDANLSDAQKAKLKKNKLVELRDSVLRLQLIFVELGAEDDAYLIFETLNTRGKDLTVSDLVKNHLTRLLRPKNKGVDQVKDKWGLVLKGFASSEAELNINRFLHHAWLSRRPNTTEKNLYKEIKRTVSKSNAQQFLDTLVEDSKVYREILDPESTKWPRQLAEVEAAIRALNTFRVVQPVPMLLAILRAYRTKQLSLTQTRSVLRKMEDFHVHFTAVTAQRTGGGTASMYSSSARLLFEANDKNSKQLVLKEFVDKLRQRVPGDDEFDAGIADIRFLDGNTRSRPVVRYLLRRLDLHLRAGAEPNYEKFSIEHIAPQNPAKKSSLTKDEIGSLGNLLFIPESLNAKLKNLDPKKKLQILKSEGLPLDSVLCCATDWGSDEITARTQVISRMLRQDVLKV